MIAAKELINKLAEVSNLSRSDSFERLPETLGAVIRMIGRPGAIVSQSESLKEPDAHRRSIDLTTLAGVAMTCVVFLWSPTVQKLQ